ncbi:MAG: hypothetical protein QOE03_3318 [Micromonosporaceae bacterium]|jgi:peptidoglycan/xylan/chitin deacetylase (PgdA/CDA1 family)|nr:hypothetical protein [Micromonosporaceae bacterium]
MAVVAGSVPILMYHSVAPTTTDGFRPYTVTPARLREHLAALRAAGWRPVTFAAAAAMLAADRPPPADVVALTFDDGLADFATHALPQLAAHAATATLFVPTAYVGARAGWLSGADADRRLLSWPGLADVAAAGIEIGSHGHQHVGLDVGSAASVRDEAARSRGILCDRLGRDVRTFAYPFGYQTRAARTAVRAAGYDAACSVVDLHATTVDSRYALPRLTATQQLSGDELVALLSHRFPPRERRWRHGKQRVYGLARRTGRIGPRPHRLPPPGHSLSDGS